MTISIFDLFTIGVGPSSSHTVGPMWAARRFLLDLQEKTDLATISAVKVELFGSLAYTGKGHGTDRAVLMGLEGETPESVDPDTIVDRCKQIIRFQKLQLLGEHTVKFEEDQHWSRL